MGQAVYLAPELACHAEKHVYDSNFDGAASRFSSLQNSIIFLPRDAVHTRGLCSRAVAGWVSVTFVYCVEMAKDTVIVVTECE